MVFITPFFSFSFYFFIYFYFFEQLGIGCTALLNEAAGVPALSGASFRRAVDEQEKIVWILEIEDFYIRCLVDCMLLKII